MENDNLLKSCTKCGQNKSLESFYKNKVYKDGLTSECKSCNSERRRLRYAKNKQEECMRMQSYYQNSIEQRRAVRREHYYNNKGMYHHNALKRVKKIKRATLPGYDKELKEIYNNRPSGYHVDHILPLQGENVSGLHVPWNLQYLPAEENIAKSNKVEYHGR